MPTPEQQATLALRITNANHEPCFCRETLSGGLNLVTFDEKHALLNGNVSGRIQR